MRDTFTTPGSWGLSTSIAPASLQARPPAVEAGLDLNSVREMWLANSLSALFSCNLRGGDGLLLDLLGHLVGKSQSVRGIYHASLYGTPRRSKVLLHGIFCATLFSAMTLP
jgi:hypothetical protein